ncbi:MAG: siderophore-interacting protein [Stackebrandtia sp.]
MTQQSTLATRSVVELTVLRVERLTPHMVRVVMGGEDVAAVSAVEHADSYVKLLFPPPGVVYPEPFCLDTIQKTLPRQQQPVRRSYTVRDFDADLGELTIDFAVHGLGGVAGPWADRARPGDRLRMLTPKGAYSPSPQADWHLLVGDESAIPAIGAALRRMPAGTRAHVIVQVADLLEEQKFDTDADVEYTWLHRDARDRADARQELVDAVASFEFPAGQGHFFVHGEAETVMKRIRPHLLNARGVHRDWLSISGYWRLGDADEAFRRWKAAQSAVDYAD